MIPVLSYVCPLPVCRISFLPARLELLPPTHTRKHRQQNRTKWTESRWKHAPKQIRATLGNQKTESWAATMCCGYGTSDEQSLKRKRRRKEVEEGFKKERDEEKQHFRKTPCTIPNRLEMGWLIFGKGTSTHGFKRWFNRKEAVNFMTWTQAGEWADRHCATDSTWNVKCFSIWIDWFLMV